MFKVLLCNNPFQGYLLKTQHIYNNLNWKQLFYCDLWYLIMMDKMKMKLYNISICSRNKWNIKRSVPGGTYTCDCRCWFSYYTLQIYLRIHEFYLSFGFVWNIKYKTTWFFAANNCMIGLSFNDTLKTTVSFACIMISHYLFLIGGYCLFNTYYNVISR